MGCSPMSTLVLSLAGEFVAMHPAALARHATHPEGATPARAERHLLALKSRYSCEALQVQKSAQQIC